jgi:hypothetical protein
VCLYTNLQTYACAAAVYEHAWARMRSAVLQVHWMRPGTELDSMRLAVLMVSPKRVYLFALLK